MPLISQSQPPSLVAPGAARHSLTALLGPLLLQKLTESLAEAVEFGWHAKAADGLALLVEDESARKVPMDVTWEVLHGEPPYGIGVRPIELDHRHHRPPAALRWQTIGCHQRSNLRGSHLLFAKLVARIAEQLEARAVLRMQLGERPEGGGGKPSFGRRVDDDDGLAREGTHLERATRERTSRELVQRAECHPVLRLEAGRAGRWRRRRLAPGRRGG